MNKNILIGIGAIVIIAGGAWFFASNNGSTDTDINGTDDTMEQFEEESLSAKTLRELLISGKSLTCDFSHEEDGIEQTGTVYIDGERVRGDFFLGLEDSDEEAHMIRDKEWVYTWGGPFGDEGEGLKVAVREVETDNNEVGEYKEDTFDIDKETDYACRSWRADEEKFTPPSDITFREFSFSAALKEAAAGVDIELNCNVCDQAPGEEAQAQCRQALGC